MTQAATALMTDAEMDRALEMCQGERVTREGMARRIKTIEYVVLPGTTVTICNITLDSGFSVRGESACVDPANFNEELGRKIAHDNAFEKLWPLFGFLLSEQRYWRSKSPAVGSVGASAPSGGEYVLDA